MPFGSGEMSHGSNHACAYWKQGWYAPQRRETTQIDTTIHGLHTLGRHAVRKQHLPHGVRHREILCTTLGVFPAAQQVPAWRLESASCYHHTYFRHAGPGQQANGVRVWRVHMENVDPLLAQIAS